MDDPIEKLRVAKQLEAEHLAGVEEDQAEAVRLLTERSRLLLYGSIAIIAGAISAAWGSDRTVCIVPLGWGIFLCFVGAGAGWNALQLAENEALIRIGRKYASLRAAKSHVFREAEADALNQRSAAEIKNELAVSKFRRNVTSWGYGATSFGACFLAIGALYSLAGKACFAFTGWPWRYLNGGW